MSLLMPELERQLRAVVRAERLAGAPKRRRRPWLVLSAGTIVALGVAVLAVVLVGSGRAPQRTLAPRPAAHTPGCAVELSGPAPTGPRLASGRIDGTRWTLSGGKARPVLELGTRRYGFACAATLDFGLIAIPRRGFVYGFAAVPRVSRVAAAINALSDEHPRVVDAQVRVRTGGGTFYLIALPGPACTVRSLWIDAMYPAGHWTTIVGDRSAAVASTLLNRAHSTLAAALVRQYDSCPPAGALVPPQPVAAAPAHPLPAPPAGLTPAARAAFQAGERVYEKSGCAACHALAGTGNNGPGADLTKIGARLRAPAIASTLVHSPPPMPSFTALPAAQRAALVGFLSRLR